MEFEKTVDYVIIGGGSAGCVLAARLSEDPKTNVVLLEAGGEDSNPPIHIPAGYVKTMINPAINWMFETEPEAGTADRQLTMPRGKVLGGSSAINAMLYVRGQPADYDGWSQRGNHGWSYGDVLLVFSQGRNSVNLQSRQRRQIRGHQRPAECRQCPQYLFCPRQGD